MSTAMSWPAEMKGELHWLINPGIGLNICIIGLTTNTFTYARLILFTSLIQIMYKKKKKGIQLTVKKKDKRKKNNWETESSKRQ